jgi:hypothetical protein
MDEGKYDIVILQIQESVEGKIKPLVSFNEKNE